MGVLPQDQQLLPCRAAAADHSSRGWEEQYDSYVDELHSGVGSPSAAAQHVAMPPLADYCVVNPASDSAKAKSAAGVVVLSDDSQSSDWNDDDIVMTLSDGAREYDAQAMVRPIPVALQLIAQTCCWRRSA